MGERVTAQRRKIKGEANGILMIVLLLSSILIQQFLLDTPFEQCAVADTGEVMGAVVKAARQ